MIKNLWAQIRLICGNHGDNRSIQMLPHAAAEGAVARSLYGNNSMNMFYACPKYYPDQREEGEALCRNHISMKEFEEMLNYISSILEEAEFAGESINLVGAKWTNKKKTEFLVIRHTEKHIDILCLNRSSLWKK